MTTTDRHHHPSVADDLHTEVWGGDGEPVILVHGSLATGPDEWSEQRALADEGFRLLVPDRRGNGLSPAADGEDFLADADDVAKLMADGAHLVGHSYGGLAVMLAAARRPEATRSLTLLEPPVTAVATDDPAWRGLADDVRRLWTEDLPDDEWAVRFLSAVGSDPDELPADLLDAAVELIPTFRRGRPYFEADLPFDDLATATFPKLVVSGGHHPGWEAMSDALADRIDATRAVIAGAGHEIQFAGPAVNEALVRVWRSSERPRSTQC